MKTCTAKDRTLLLCLNEQIQIAPSFDKGRIWIKILDDNLEEYRWSKFDIRWIDYIHFPCYIQGVSIYL